MQNFIKTLVVWSRMIKLEHTLFSLPFVLVNAFLAFKYETSLNSDFKLDYWVFIWILLCLIGARSAGMTLNRIIDAKIDSLNPRTQDREIPSGKISLTSSWTFSFLGILILIYSAFQLPRLCQFLLPIPIIWLWIYPYLKRFTYLCHFFLGTTLGGAALGAWIAVTGTFNHVAPIYYFIAVTLWVAAFDIIYAIADLDFDKKMNLNSIPAKYGKEKALQLVRFLHIFTILFLYLAGESLHLGFIYKLTVFIFLSGLVYEQILAKKEKLEAAFFTVNSYLGIIFMLGVFLDFL